MTRRSTWPGRRSNCSRSCPTPLLLPLRAKLRKDRKSTRLNSSHTVISYAVFCLQKKISVGHVRGWSPPLDTDRLGLLPNRAAAAKATGGAPFARDSLQRVGPRARGRVGRVAGDR